MVIICERGFGAELYPCILTDWKLSSYGYGERYVKGSCVVTYEPDRKVRYRTERAHVVALTGKLGRPLTEGMQANHHCDNRACIQREHVYEGTQIQNIKDMWDRGRGYSAFRNGTLGTPRKLSAKEEDVIRQQYAGGDISMRELAGKHGICKATVSDIVHHRASHTPRKRLNLEQREEIRRRYAGGTITQDDLALEYGASPATIGNVIHRRFKDPQT
jgi:hypothetical protein